ncbi:MAG: hypothetical protein PHG91_06945 [Syntrophales bacterium]|nr:hypothetical protein [Syntrophales bacterium]MDD5534069.1 hypothetical protein [Syntrophales bacterium]
MKRKMAAISFLAFLLFLTGQVSAEKWVPVPGWPLAYYDEESIQYPEKIYFSWGIFVVVRDDRDYARVWTKHVAPEGENPRTLYEMRFSQRSCRAVYSVDEHENPIPPLDPSYMPVIPDTMQYSLFSTLYEIASDPDVEHAYKMQYP